jgi:hypothetical protein
MARRKISRKMPPLRQVVPGSQGINNYDQANIDQNEAASFNQQYGAAGNYAISTNAYGGAAVSPYRTHGNSYSGYGTSNTSQNKVTGATTDLTNNFQATTIPGSTHWNTGEHQLSGPGMAANTGRGFNLTRGGNVNTTDKKGINTFSSETDPVDKTEFQNEVVSNIMKSDPVVDLSNPVEAARPQNKFEELYKPS